MHENSIDTIDDTIVTTGESYVKISSLDLVHKII